MCKGKLARKSVGRLILTLRAGKIEEDEQNITLVAQRDRKKRPGGKINLRSFPEKTKSLH
jgi:hypothetical protein